MRISPEQLDAQLARKLAPVYAIHGDEPLLALEAADAVRAAARGKGYREREVFQPERNFDWGELRHAGASRSLFGDRKIVELRLTSGKPAAQAAEALVQWCQAPNDEALLLLTMPRPEGRGWWEADWFTALDRAGVVVEVKSIERRALPRWLGQRLARQQQSAPPEVLEFLAARVEGNLLAAHQEVQKLALLAPQGELSLEMVEQAVANVARYDPLDAAEALVGGDLARYVRVIEGLRAEGEHPVYLLSVLSPVLFGIQGSERPYNKRLQAIVEGASGRLPRALVDEAIAHAASIDRAAKGVGGAAEAWELLLTLGLKLAHGSKA